MNHQEIEKVRAKVYDIIYEDPDRYTEFVNTAAAAWAKVQKDFNKNLAGLDMMLWDLVTPKKAKEMLKNKNKPGNLRLDQFNSLRETLDKIANSSK